MATLQEKATAYIAQVDASIAKVDAAIAQRQQEITNLQNNREILVAEKTEWESALTQAEQ